MSEKRNIPTLPGVDLRLPQPPFFLIAAFIVVVILTWVPLVLIAKSRVTPSKKPRIHLFQDMDHQPRYIAQQTNTTFPDRRAMRPRVPGTVARGSLETDDHYHRGGTVTVEGERDRVEFRAGFPDEVTIDLRLLERGRERYNIYCALCHGHDGYGKGAVSERAMKLTELDPASNRWALPSNLHSDAVRSRTEGELYDVIRNGKNNMPAYGHKIGVEDRWAIVAYMRALQLSQNADYADVPAEARERIR